MTQLELAWREERDAALAQVEANAGQSFTDKACAFVLTYLRERGPSSGESITLACKAAGIKPHDDRAFGPVYMRLIRSGAIEKCGTVRRMRGHGTAGGSVYRLVSA